MSILIGIDWSKDHHNVCIMNESGAVLVNFQIPHSPAGLAELEARITPFQLPPAECLVALETAHSLVMDFVWSRGYAAYVIAPSVVSSSRGRYAASKAHDDERDAWILADLLRTDRQRFVPWRPDGPLVTQMRAKLSLIDALTQASTRYANRLYALLQRYYPQFLGVFSDLQTQIGLQFLIAYPTPEHSRTLSFAQFEAFCRARHYSRPQHLPELYARLQRPTFAPDPLLALTYQNETRFLAQLLLSLVQQKNTAIQEVRTLYAAHPDAPIFDSLPGAGDLLAPKLLVMFGDQRERFPAPAVMQSLAGTCPVTAQSGHKRYVYFRRACNHEYRNVAQQFAIASTQAAAWAATYFNMARARGMSKSHAYRCLANRWLGIIWKLWQTHQVYDEDYHVQQIQQHRRPQG